MRYLYFGETAPAAAPAEGGPIPLADMIKSLGAGLNIPANILSEAQAMDAARVGAAPAPAPNGAAPSVNGGGTYAPAAPAPTETPAAAAAPATVPAVGDSGQNGAPATTEGQMGGGVIPVEVEMFGTKKKIGGEQSGTPGVGDAAIDYSKPDAVIGYMKQMYGDDISGFLNNVKTWQEQAQKAEKIEADYKNAIRAVEILPEEIYELADAYWRGQNWKDIYNQKNVLDFGKKFEDHNVEDIVEHYYPGQFKEDDFEDIKGNKGLQIAIMESKNKYNANQQTKEQARVQMLQKVESQNRAYTESVSKAIAKLEKDFPEVDGSTKQEIADYLRRGNFNDMIYNNDMTLNENAAINVLLRSHGAKAIRNLESALRSRIEGQVNEDVLARGKKIPEERKPGGGASGTGDRVQQYLANIGMGLEQKRTY